MTLYKRLCELPLRIERYSLVPHEQSNPGGFQRLSTVIRLEGDGDVGCGEDPTYTANNQRALQEAGAKLPLAGEFTLASFSQHLESLNLWPDTPQLKAYVDYRRWAYESAALELALAQGGTSLAEVLGRVLRPAKFVVSTGLGSPPSMRRLEELLAFEPRLRFKLDTSNDWDDAFVAELAALDRVDVVDFKGAYVGTPVDQEADLDLYQRVIAGLPNAFLEDPHANPEVQALLQDDWARVTWDAIIHSVDDVQALPVAPKVLNIKPSRCGTLQRLFDLYDYCEANGIAMYGGGQFELADGRRQIQELAGIFHPDASNDIGPVEFNRPELARPISDQLLAYFD